MSEESKRAATDALIRAQGEIERLRSEVVRFQGVGVEAALLREQLRLSQVAFDHEHALLLACQKALKEMQTQRDRAREGKR